MRAAPTYTGRRRVVACESVQVGTDGLHVSPRLAERLDGCATRQVVHVLKTLPGLSWLIVAGGKVIAGGRASPDVVPAPDGVACPGPGERCPTCGRKA